MVVLFIMANKAVVISASVDEIIQCYHYKIKAIKQYRPVTQLRYTVVRSG